MRRATFAGVFRASPYAAIESNAEKEATVFFGFSRVTSINDEKGIPMILVEQNAHIALSHSQRTHVFENGRVTHEGPSEEIKKTPATVEASLGV